MPMLNMTVAHKLTQGEATSRIRKLLAAVKSQYADKISDLHEEWKGDTGTFRFSAMGFPVSVTLTVRSSDLDLAAELPFAAMLFQAQIESTIRERAEELLA